MPLPIQPLHGRAGRAFLVEHRGVLSLVDTGGPGSWGRVNRAVERVGRRPEDIRQVLLTHSHGDHAGTAARLGSEHGIPVVVGGGDAGVVEGRDPYPRAPAAWGWATYGWSGISRFAEFADSTPGSVSQLSRSRSVRRSDHGRA